MKKQVFRLSNKLKAKLDAVSPPRQRRQSELIRHAVAEFLCKPKQPLADRPHVRGRDKAYKEVCANLEPAQMDVIKTLYPDISISVVIEAAVSSELRKAQYKIVGLPNGNPTNSKPTTDAENQNTDDYSCTRSSTRELAPTVD